ncbi:hypothetical protein [uncultured Treponema sp.]|uniref:hypothetical protein n=1 Tax=uncultured Treponema sp. TaxID=162155 RepID=UPI0025CE127A|nr:hypothetical protein [uncultured Treponema sp.]
MKSKVYGVGLGSSIFILLLIASLALVRPVYLRLNEALSDLENTLIKKLEDETGLSLSYESLSPSVFVGVNFKNISVHEVSTKNKILQIRRASLSYNVAGFFSKNPVVALKELTLSGVTVEFDALQNSQFIDKIKNLLEKRKESNDILQKDMLTAEKDSKFSLAEKEFDLPLDINVKNLSLHYSDKQNDALVTLKSLKLKDFNFSDGVGIDTNGKIFCKTGVVKTDGKWTSFACNFSVSGTLFPDMEGSSALLSLSGASGADYTLSRLDMLLNYSEEKFEVRTMRTVLPFSLFARYDMSDSSLTVSGDFDRFNPLKLVSIRRKNPTLHKIDGTTISGSLSARIDKNDFTYLTDIKLAVPKKILGESVDLTLKADGDKEIVNISKLAANGSFIDADFSGSFDIKAMQPSGLFTLDYFTLKNGGIISTEIFVDPYHNGFTCVAPQIFMNEKSFTGVQFTLFPGENSVDFQFELLDFAHPDYEETGRVRIDGSFLTGKEKFVQASVLVSDVFADSIVDTLAFFMPEDKKATFASISENVRPYIFKTEAYLSSDFKEFSLNAPDNLLANTEKDLELVRFAVDGSKQTFQVSQFDLLFGRQAAHAEIALEFADSFRQFSFTSDLTVNSVPYRFFGNFSPEWIAVSGDYNFDAIISIDNQIGATVQFSQLPFSIGKYVFSASTSSVLRLDSESGFEADIVSLEIDEPSSYLQFSPHLALSGSLSKYGFVLSTLAYSDTVSTLDGTGNVVWNLNENILDSVHASLIAESPISAEKFTLSADLTNPNQLPFSADALKNDFYLSVEAELKSFPASRLLSFQNPENTVSADFTASGTISNPFVSIMLHRSSLLLYGYPMVASGSFFLDDTGIHFENLNCDWSVLKISDAKASFDPGTFKGKSSLTVDAELMSKTLHAPFEISIEGAPPEKKFSVPDYYSVSLTSKEITGDFIASDFPLNITAMHTPGRWDVMTDVSNGFKASYTDGGKIFASAGKGSPVQFNLSGSIEQNNLNLDLTGIAADMRFICSEIEIPFVSFNSGFLSGALRISGPTTDPEFTGAFSVSHPNFVIPFISQNYLHADKVIMTVGQGEAVVTPTLVTLGKGLATVEYRMDFNRWVPNSLELKINIDDNRKVPLDLSFPFIHAKGLASGNLSLAYTLPNDVSVSGFVIADDTDVEIVATSLQNQFSLDNILDSVPNKNPSSLNLNVDFDIIVGQKVQLLFNPFLRGIVAPGTPLSIYFDSYTGDLEFKSDISLRGGEIVWLNRNFYMKEGRIVFNETQDSIDPKVTVRAETRERDENGNMVSIILSATNQAVSTFNPTFSANPAKSEREIMQLLGQVISADSSGVSDILGSGGDFFIQSTVMRRVENTLRELLNFDIFSIRTNVLQNSLKLSMDDSTNNKQPSIGNFIDNSTVYMGKYFGSSIYVDSMLHWSYDENRIDNGTSVNGVILQPEFGFEMSSPFVNIRLGVAPDIDSLQKGLLNTWVPSTSMTLSWKFSF